MITIAALSDLHGWFDYKEVYTEPELIIIAGDIFKSDYPGEQKKELPIFLERMNEIFPKADSMIICPGNHDFLIERDRNILPGNIKLLIDSGYEYLSSTGETLKIYGNPRTQTGLYAFQRKWNESDIKNIPRDLDILITHDSPRFYGLSCIRNSLGDYGFEEPGSKKLADHVLKVKPRIHIFGHIHKPCTWENENTKFYNVSQIPTRKPVILRA